MRDTCKCWFYHSLLLLIKMVKWEFIYSPEKKVTSSRIKLEAMSEWVGKGWKDQILQYFSKMTLAHSQLASAPWWLQFNNERCFGGTQRPLCCAKSRVSQLLNSPFGHWTWLRLSSTSRNNLEFEVHFYICKLQALEILPGLLETDVR